MEIWWKQDIFTKILYITKLVEKTIISYFSYVISNNVCFNNNEFNFINIVHLIYMYQQTFGPNFLTRSTALPDTDLTVCLISLAFIFSPLILHPGPSTIFKTLTMFIQSTASMIDDCVSNFSREK